MKELSWLHDAIQFTVVITDIFVGIICMEHNVSDDRQEAVDPLIR